MKSLRYYLDQVFSLFIKLFSEPSLRDIIDVLLVAVFIYMILRLVAHTRVSSIFKGLAIVLVVTAVMHILDLYTASWIMDKIISVGVVLLVVLFAPEIRRWLEQLGRTEFASRVFRFATQHRQSSTDKQNRCVMEIVNAYMSLSRRRVGALIVIERKTPLTKVIETGTTLDSEISAPLIENIFEPNTPLHDGAVVISGDRIVAAACILELSNDRSISRELGTRHRAAIGVTEDSDAVSLIVSEETGTISLARDGHLTRHLDEKSLTVLLTEYFSEPSEQQGIMNAFLPRRKEAPDSEKA